MRIFIGWSGELSRQAAFLLRDWLPSVIQAIDPFVSEDIEKGTRWFQEIDENLKDINFGILCITPENLEARWIHYEAGAISNKVGPSFVVPLLINVSNSDIEGPLANFQTASFSKDDIYKLLKTINSRLGSQPLSEIMLDKAFQQWWPSFDANLEKTIKESTTQAGKKATKPARGVADILEELLELTRNIERNTTKRSALSLALSDLHESDLSKTSEGLIPQKALSDEFVDRIMKYRASQETNPKTNKNK